MGLTRDRERARQLPGGSGYRWRCTDLFSRAATFESLAGADRAVYLVHSLHPSARLTQGRVGDLDLICADNFARAARDHGIEHIVYLRAPVPDREDIPPYLESRREVERTLESYGTPVTTLCTAMVLGAGGTTPILLELVRRLPLMVLPRWADNPIAPIARRDLAELIARLVPRTDFAGRAHHIGAAGVTTFRQMLQLVAELTGRPRRLVTVPMAVPRLATRWISRFTGFPRWRVRALVERLRADVSPGDFRLHQTLGAPRTPVHQVLLEAVKSTAYQPSRPSPAVTDDSALMRTGQPNEVRAVHRLTLPPHRDVRWLVDEYFRWLPACFRPFIGVDHPRRNIVRILFSPLSHPLLVLEYDRRASDDQRELFWLRSGLLVDPHEPGRLEFRTLLDGTVVLAAIHEFRPRLPWYVYVGTQARFHHFVMGAFDRHLRRHSPRLPPRNSAY